MEGEGIHDVDEERLYFGGKKKGAEEKFRGGLFGKVKVRNWVKQNDSSAGFGCSVQLWFWL